MAIKRRVIQACCGRKSFIFEIEKPIRKFQISILEGAGYSAPDNFKKAGIFYVRKGNLVATASYGTRMVKIRCHGNTCAEQLDQFENILEQAINTTTLGE